MQQSGIGRGLAIIGSAALLAGASPQTMPQEARFDWFEYSGSDPVDASAKLKPGDYRNPILQGFYPDPSITRVGDDYYLVTSTFSYFPGIPVFHSRDLVNWTQIGNAIDRPDQLDFGTLGLSRGVFAPAIEHHAGTFYILNTCVDCGDNFVITATDPKGPWSDPVWLPEMRGGIDPSLFVDADGSAWILNNGPPVGTPRYEGHRAVWIQRFDLKTQKMVGPRTMLVDGGVDPSTNPIWIEGPHIIPKDGWYYLICAEGGTAEGHSQVVLRSRKVDGPYTPYPGNPILTQRDMPRDRANPITSAGHADFVQLPNGDWWATFLAVRPYRGDYYNTGRETFLMPVEWRGEWPHITARGQAIPYTANRPALPAQAKPAIPTNGPFTVREEFDGQTLGPHWMMMRNPRETWHRLADGVLRLTPRREGLGDNANPSFLARRQQHQVANASTLVDFTPTGGAQAGLAALQSDDYWFAIAVAGNPREIRVTRRAGPDVPKGGTVVARAPAPDGRIRLRIRGDRDRYRFDYAPERGEWRTLHADADGTLLSTKTAGGFVGAVFGPFAQSGAGE